MALSTMNNKSSSAPSDTTNDNERPQRNKKGNQNGCLSCFSAEGEGFEPPVPLSTTVFKTVVIDHSTIPPKTKGMLMLSQSLSLYALRGSNPGPID